MVLFPAFAGIVEILILQDYFANFVSMITYTGVIELVYYNREIRIPYTMTNLGGNPHIYFSDKYGHHHGFFYRSSTGEWLYNSLKEPNWRKDFMDVLLVAIDMERQRHGL